MAINFPDNPNVNDEFTSPTGKIWIWTGTTWKAKSINTAEYMNDTTDIHGISDTSLLVYQSDLADYAPLANAIFSGTISLPQNTSIGNVSSAEIQTLDGISTNIQSQIDAKANTSHQHTLSDIPSITASAAELNVLDGVIVSSTEINYLLGTTSSIQDQINNHSHTVAKITDLTASASEINLLDGANVTTTEINYLSGVTSSIQSQLSGKANTSHAHTVSQITDITATTAEINYLSGTTSNVQAQINGKASTSHTHTLSAITDVTASASEVNVLDGANVTTTEINYLSGVTSGLQSQLNGKASLSGATFSGNIEVPNVTITGNLLVQGTTTTINTTDYAIRDNMIYMNQAGQFTVTNAVGNGTAVTYTAPGHDFQAGDYIVITGITPSGYNIAGTELLTIASVATNTFVVNKTTTGTYVSGGLARGKSAANPDLGFSAGRTTAQGYAHAGLFRDATDATWKFYDGYTPEPDESLYIDTAHASFALAPLAISNLSANNVTLTGTLNLNSALVTGVFLDELDDVAITSAATSDVLFYNGTTWVNRYINAIPAKTSQVTLTTNNYNISNSDAGMILEVNNTSAAATVTIPSTESFAVGTQIVILQTGAGGNVTIQVQTPASQTLNFSPGAILRGQWSAATLLKRATNTWVLYGDLKA